MGDRRSILGDRRGYSKRFVRDIGKLIKEDTLKREREARLKPKTVEPEAAKQESKKSSDSNVRSIDDFLVIPGIECVGADGNVFERYDKIYVAGDVERDGKQHRLFESDCAISHFESNGMFLPSFALACNVLSYLFSHRDDEAARKLLMQYKDHGAGYGWHVQNTTMDWKYKTITHYPLEGDFGTAYFYDNSFCKVNSSRQHNFYLHGFEIDGLGDMMLEDALKKEKFNYFIRNLTGLATPEILVEIGKYFDRPAKIWVADDPSRAEYTASSVIGCGSATFDIVVYDFLYNKCAASGVREP